MKLTEKQAAFVAAYLIDPNKKSAAILAGYKPESAAVEGCRLMKVPKVLEALGLTKTPKAIRKKKVQAKVKHRKSARPAAVKAPLLVDQATVEQGKSTPLEYMLRVMNDPASGNDRRDAMARAAAPYVHGKIGEGGKKDQKQDAAKRAAGGRFGAPSPPRLTLVGGNPG